MFETKNLDELSKADAKNQMDWEKFLKRNFDENGDPKPKSPLHSSHTSQKSRTSPNQTKNQEPPTF